MTFEAAMRQVFDHMINERDDPRAMIRWAWLKAEHRHDQRVRDYLNRNLWAPSPSASTGSSSATEGMTR